jgi:hypothetical protein
MQEQVANIVVFAFAVFLCVVNAVVWTVVSELPLMGVAWLVAAAFCFKVQKWNRG